MYTQCPACHTAFRVTARVLQQAAGRVRCGGCGSAFNALEYLSEELPADNVESPAPRPAGQADVKKKKMLEKLDELTGPETVVIE
ncbi:MAG TPA: MJ0042-type zinc finger domain-containing protein, partial [Woeseiaceae bacterium]